MEEKGRVLNEIIEYYLGSRDFNGLPINQMKHYDYNTLCSLIDDGMIEVISDKEFINPHIKAFDFNIPIERQKENIRDRKKYSVLYPTRNALNNISSNDYSPYTLLMRKGEPQFKIVFFNIEILERYVNNPKFLIIDSGYRGNIMPKDEYCEDETIEDEYIKDYGMAYIKGENLERAIGVFISDLAKLSSM